MRLGRLPCAPADLARAPSILWHASTFAPPPAVLDRRDVDYRPRMFGNNILPDCSAAGLANLALAVSTLAGAEIAIDDALVPAFYAACVGCAPTESAMAATDGAVLLDVLRRQVVQGFDVGGQTAFVGLSGTVPLRRTYLAQIVSQLGGAYLGVDLYERDMEGGAVWDADGRDPGALVGGHCVVMWDYLGLADTDTLRIATWGGLQSVTWRWLANRLREAHGVFWRQLAPADSSPIDADALAGELRAWAA